MFKNASVSVVLNVWTGDSQHDLDRSVRSVISQSLQPDELILVVDGIWSVDPPLLLSSYQTEFSVKIIEMGCNVGLAMARNVGISAASNELIALHDADDVMHSLRLERMVAGLRNSTSDVVVCQAVEFDSVTGLIDVARVTPVSESELRKAMVMNNVISHSTALFRKSSLISTGGYRDVWRMEDYELWLRLLIEGKKIEILDDVLQALSRDPNYLKRRRGTGFLKSELYVGQRAFKLAVGLSKGSVLLSILKRMAFRLCPSALQRVVYRFLRHRVRLPKAMTLDEFQLSSWKWTTGELEKCI